MYTLRPAWSHRTRTLLGIGSGLLLLVAGLTIGMAPDVRPATPEDAATDVSDSPLQNGWATVETENEPTARHENAFVEARGKFYLLGGRGDRPVDVYDPSTDRWTEGPAPPFQMHHFQAVTWEDDIYVVCAWSDDFPRENGLSHVYVYDTGTNTWRRDAPIPPGRRRGSAGVVVHEDRIYVVGGNVGGHGPHSTAVGWLDVFDPETGEWTALRERSAPHPRDHFQAAVVDGRLFAVGGRNSGVEGFIDSTIAAVDVYDFDTGTWTTWEDAPLPTERAGSTTIGYDEEVIITGGEGFGQTWGQTEALDLESREWRSLGSLDQPRHGTQMFVYRDQLYIAAGSGDQGGGPELTGMERYTMD